jgi:RES domain-containing protein
MPLSASLRAALENLHRKESGEAVDWINIADARALTELGFARRSHQGWEITEAGREAHGAQPQAHDDGDSSGRVVAYP